MENVAAEAKDVITSTADDVMVDAVGVDVLTACTVNV
jgi:hypothetical protein